MASVGNHHKFKEWLLREMGKREWSQSDLARSADLNRAVISKLLNGHANPRLATLEAIARALKIPVAGIFRIARLLPELPESDGYMQEVIHHLKQSRSPRRKATVLWLIKVLVSGRKRNIKKK